MLDDRRLGKYQITALGDGKCITEFDLFIGFEFAKMKNKETSLIVQRASPNMHWGTFLFLSSGIPEFMNAQMFSFGL